MMQAANSHRGTPRLSLGLEGLRHRFVWPKESKFSENLIRGDVVTL